MVFAGNGGVRVVYRDGTASTIPAGYPFLLQSWPREIVGTVINSRGHIVNTSIEQPQQAGIEVKSDELRQAR